MVIVWEPRKFYVNESEWISRLPKVNWCIEKKNQQNHTKRVNLKIYYNNNKTTAFENSYTLRGLELSNFNCTILIIDVELELHQYWPNLCINYSEKCTNNNIKQVSYLYMQQWSNLHEFVLIEEVCGLLSVESRKIRFFTWDLKISKL